MAADLSRQLKFPAEIITTSLRPDIVIWSARAKAVIMVELTVPWEEHMESAYERKKDKYAELAAMCSQAGWRPFTFPVEVGCRGFTGTSTQRLLKTLGVTGWGGGGRELLAMAQKEGWHMGERRLLVTLGTQSGWCLTQGDGRPCHAQSLATCSTHTMTITLG